MREVLVWTDRRGWLSRADFPEVHRLYRLSPLSGQESPPDPLVIVIADAGSLPAERIRALVRDAAPPAAPVIVVGGTEEAGGDAEDLFFDVLPEPPPERELLRALRNATYLIESERKLIESRAAAEQKARELEELNAIGIALSAERDHERLLRLILSKSREITRADAGSLFLVEEIDLPIGPESKAGDQRRVTGRWLRFRLAQNDSRDFRFEEQVLPIGPESIAGYVAQTGETLNIEDAYRLEQGKAFTINRSFDEATGYRTRSVLVVPMQNHEGDTLGVLQLINKKQDRDLRLTDPESFDRDVLAFTPLDEQLVRSLASQAAVSVENNKLYQRIERLFADFVEASVRAIESRDPTTRGHSRRVALMTAELARVTNRTTTGPYGRLELSEEAIRELKYAALLHDFGKVGVSEKVLKKATKLHFGRLSLVRERFRNIKRTVQAERLRELLERLLRAGAAPRPEDIAAFDEELARELARIDEALEEVERANRPTVTHFSDFQRIEQIAKRSFSDLDGSRRPFLEREEILALSVSRGTLTERERREIQSHVVHTYEFLATIPWTRDLQGIPKLARSHHEKLDGTGYPHGLPADDIPPQTRMMTIADIFDALAAQDRPYKPAVPTERALDILREEAGAGKIDPDLLAIFIEAKVFEIGRQ